MNTDAKVMDTGARLETESVHSVDKAALVWQHMRENSGLSDEVNSLYGESGLWGPPWL